MNVKGRCCPLCERPWPNEGSFSPLWKRIVKYADGTRTSAEIAKLIGSTKGTVQMSIVHMRRMGIDVKGRQKTPKYVPDRGEYEKLRAYRLMDMTWREIGQRIGLSEAATKKRAQRLEEAFGELPGQRRGIQRDRASDYVRIRELRVDAQLPWKMVGKALGMNQYYVARYFADLCKVYGN